MPLGSTKGSFFIITWVSAGKFKNITRLQDVTVNFFLRRTTISAIIFPNINYTTHLLGCKYDLSIPTTILYGILSCKYIVFNAPLFVNKKYISDLRP
ncbi:hypothetical protein RhiirA5_44964 [Rhizophagus irregularis]|uniref:Uncharacterized protein n=1 Tax=Rhizophagus irregularis TaxID=588596 RepID=A0A2N1NN74_9GLOM|nr:hypothetical protein RhiirA5_44964 [Rhizophagus irregularis]PKK75330.1 hypothetical protein RhiirC2_242173 [Rhizophagus irregularis]